MTFVLHDVTRLPYVELRSEACTPGFAALWCEEMDALLVGHQCFLIAFDPAAIQEEPEDFRMRAIWFKANRDRLAGRCAGMVAIVAEEKERSAIADDLVKRSRGFGIPYLALPSFSDARAATPDLVRQSELTAIPSPPP